MNFQSFKKIPRLSRDMVITEKIDGTNGVIAIKKYSDVTTFPLGTIDIENNGEHYIILSGSRNKWINSKEDNAGFAKWVFANREELIKLGEGYHYGEWWGQGIQRNYGLKEKRFSLFNVSRWLDDSVRPACCSVVPILYTGLFNTSKIDEILLSLATNGSQAVPGFMRPEGIVIFHKAGGYFFKKTIEKDEFSKTESQNEY